MSTSKEVTDRSVGGYNLDERDIEKAELASPYSWSSTIVEPSASTKSKVVGMEQSEAIDPSLDSKRSTLHAVEDFLSRTASAIFPRVARRLKDHYKRKEMEKEMLRELYSKLISHRPSIKEYPPGWPQLAALLHSEDNFAIFRRFGMTRCRVLVQLQAEIQLLEQQLSELDHEDYKTPDRSWRLQMADIEDGRAPYHAAQRSLLKKLQEKFLAYDQLLLNEQKLRELGPVKSNDHLSVYHWIYREKPLGPGQYNWINHATDFVPLSRTDRFEYSILNSFFKRIFRSKNNQQGIVNHYSESTVSAAAKLISVLLAVAVLVVPVFILLWIPETRAWISATVLISVFVFSALMSLLTEARVQEVLVGTAAYCAVLATFLGNTQAGSNLR
ncbi:hypothetical protein EG329_005278 [Mollisiaceae sp. DMI_Dod_QoI]|nr:hypothetical protein EG329_005278 [Helotiales sp. DMI_Dod_QoI]